jgi:hypothetical protein
MALVAGALKLPTNFLLLVRRRVAARKDLRHPAGPRWDDSEALNAHCIQDDTAMAEINNPEETVAGGSAEIAP